MLLVATCGLVLVTAGCKAPIQKAEFKAGAATVPLKRHPLRVALVLDSAFCKLQQKRDPEGYIYPLGEFLCPCARHLANQAFAKVTEFDSVDAAMKSSDADALLAPKFVKLEIRARGVAWDKRHALVVLEWTLKSIKDQKTIWLATAEGRAEGTVGTAFSMDGKDREAFQEAMDDLYQKSAKAFNESEEIKSFAAKLGK